MIAAGECWVPGGPHGLQNRRRLVTRVEVGSIPTLSDLCSRADGCLSAHIPPNARGCNWLRLHYTHTREGQKLDYKLRLTYSTTPCSARRWFFLCPLVANDRPCDRRVGKLYLPPGAKYFGCRHCNDLTYTSCRESHRFDLVCPMFAESTGMGLAEVKQALEEGRRAPRRSAPFQPRGDRPRRVRFPVS